MSEHYPEVSLFHSEARVLASSIVDTEYDISVGLPPSYLDSDKTYPVLYLLDGNICFGMATDTVTALTFGQEVPELIVVGIGYHITSYADWGSNRTRDYTATAREDAPGSGGAAQFLAFVETELIPFIDANYRTDPEDRAISGYSHGGQFVLYALLSRPGLFNRYACGSPSIYWDDRAMFRREEAFSQNQSQLPVKLFISVGSLESFEPDVRDFVEALKSRNYKGLDLTTVVLEDETHLSCLAPAFVRGVRAIYS